MAKVTQAAMRVRIKSVQKLLLRGHTRSYLLEYGADKWQIGDRQVDEYIKIATDEIDEINKNSAEHNLALITSNLWKLYRRQLKKEPGSARGILLDIAKLRGLDRIDINLHVERPLKDLSDDQLTAALMAGTASA